MSSLRLTRFAERLEQVWMAWVMLTAYHIAKSMVTGGTCAPTSTEPASEAASQSLTPMAILITGTSMRRRDGHIAGIDHGHQLALIIIAACVSHVEIHGSNTGKNGDV